MSVAYLLARAGKSVVVLDDGPVGGGETSRTTAHLSNAIDDQYFEIDVYTGRRKRGWQRKATRRRSRESRR
jgi:glycine/D-amino acid oxidase-like deaminating enzyme